MKLKNRNRRMNNNKRKRKEIIENKTSEVFYFFSCNCVRFYLIFDKII